MSSEQDQRDREQSPAKIAADLIELAVEYGADDEDLQPIIEKAIAKLVADTRAELASLFDPDAKQCAVGDALAMHMQGFCGCAKVAQTIRAALQGE